jgi:hypothetical protein
MYNDIVFANVDFEDFITLQSRIRSERGFIRSIDNNNQVIKVSIDMEYSLAKKRMDKPKKSMPINMTISTQNEFILVSNKNKIRFIKI